MMPSLRRPLLGLALLAACLASPTRAATDADGFTPLFNGKDLSGWVNVNCAPETFTVVPGTAPSGTAAAQPPMIHCDGIPTGALRTDRPYENFILELEWRHLKVGGNAGVFIWSSPLPAVGQPFLRAIEVQVLDHGYGQSDWFTTHGDVFPIHGATMKPFAPSKGDRSFPREKHSNGSPEWNHYRIVATNGVLRLSVNGFEVSGGTNCNWRKGYIALESEGGVVDWRNLRIRELPSTGATPAQSAPPAEPWRSLYEGRSLRAWTVPDGAASAWTAADWTLRAAAATGAPTTLWTSGAFAAEECFLDWRWDGRSADRVPPLVLRFGDRTETVSLPALPAAKADGWNRLHLRRRGATLSLELNGTPAGSVPAAQGPLRLGLRQGAVPIQFASVFVK